MLEFVGVIKLSIIITKKYKNLFIQVLTLDVKNMKNIKIAIKLQ